MPGTNYEGIKMAAVTHLIVELRSDHRQMIGLALELKEALDAASAEGCLSQGQSRGKPA